jgi:hypothetical protein
VFGRKILGGGKRYRAPSYKAEFKVALNLAIRGIYNELLYFVDLGRKIGWPESIHGRDPYRRC